MKSDDGAATSLVSVGLESTDDGVKLETERDEVKQEETNKHHWLLQFLMDHSSQVFSLFRLPSQIIYTMSSLTATDTINYPRLIGGCLSVFASALMLFIREKPGTQTDLERLTQMSWSKYFAEMTSRMVLPHKYPRNFNALCDSTTSILYIISGSITGRWMETVSSGINIIFCVPLLNYIRDTDLAWTLYGFSRSIFSLPTGVPNVAQSIAFDDYLAATGISMGIANFFFTTFLNGMKVSDKLKGKPFKDKCFMVMTGKIPALSVEVKDVELQQGVER